MTVALGTNIANPISTALSQWLGFDTMGKLANYGKLGVTDPDAVIKALFANSEQGLWYDSSDLTTMFQDIAGTTPVTADSQPVGKILDKSGRSNHAAASADAKRPLYRTSGGLRWWQSDGVDDCLFTGNMDFSTTNKLTFVFGGSAFGNDSAVWFEFGAETYGTPGGFQFRMNDSTTVGRGPLVEGNRGFNNLNYVKGTAEVLSGRLDLGGTTPATMVFPRINGVLTQNDQSSSGDVTGNFANTALYMAMRANSSRATALKNYALILINRRLTDQELADTEAWVAAKTGVVLP